MQAVLALQVKLVQHTYSCLYGTFLANNPCEREKRNIYKRTCSVWALLRAGNKNFHNFLYTPGSDVVSPNLCPVGVPGRLGQVRAANIGPKAGGKKRDLEYLPKP